MKDQFIAKVMQVMNEIGWNDRESDSFIGSDDTKLSAQIEAVFVDAWRKAVNLFPKSYFEVKDFSAAEVVTYVHSGVGYVVLPDDFDALVRFKMHGWSKSVETLNDRSDEIASVQSNVYTRGNFKRPVCIRDIKRIPDGRMVPVLKYYSLPLGYPHKIEDAIYIPMIEPLSDDTIISNNLFIPLAYLCASQIYNIFEKYDIAKLLESKSIEIIN